MNLKTILFENKGQGFYEWVVNKGVIIDCRPHQANIWVGKEVLVDGNTAFVREGENGIPVDYRVISFKFTNKAYVQGLKDSKSNKKDQVLYDQEEQYRFGFHLS